MRNYLKTTNQVGMVNVDSAATSNYHTGENPHHGGQKCAKNHGFDISKHRARQVTKKDFDTYDLVIAMDKYTLWVDNVRCRSNVEDLEYMKNSLNPNGKGQIKMLSDFLPGQEGREVPDAYYARGI